MRVPLLHNTTKKYQVGNIVDETGLSPFSIGTVGDITVTISKNETDVGALTLVGAAPAAGERLLTQINPGVLEFELDASDVDTLGQTIIAQFSDPDAMVPWTIEGFVVSAPVYNWLVGATSNVDANVTALTAAALLSIYDEIEGNDPELVRDRRTVADRSNANFKTTLWKSETVGQHPNAQLVTRDKDGNVVLTRNINSQTGGAFILGLQPP